MRTRVFLLIAAAILLSSCEVDIGQEVSVPAATVQEEAIFEATLVLYDGVDIATYSAELVAETSVLDLLLGFAEANEFVVEVDEYDFGTLVTSIDGKVNRADRVWIYYVNGSAGDLGAGDKLVRQGDVVEWKYEEPIY